MKYTRIVAAVICCLASVFLLSAQHENLQTKVINGKEFYIYKVKPSEGFYSISLKFKVSQEEIIQHNPAAKKGLKNGQLLMIPKGKSTTTKIGSSFKHTITRGETLTSIAKTYKVTIKDIVALNPGADKGIKAGETLNIPQGYKAKKAKATVQPAEKTAPPTKVVDPVTTTPPSSEEESSDFVFHTIARGETLYAISQKYGVSVESILKLNPGLSPRNMKAGAVIRLTPDSQNDKGQIDVDSVVAEPKTKLQYTPYTVRKKETLYSISKKFNTTVEEIKLCNPGLRGVKQNDVINIPSGIVLSETSSVEKPITDSEIENIYNKLYKCDKRSAINVAVMLPFMLNQSRPKTKAKLYTEYYKGFLLAVDSLKRSGSSINLYAYDTEESDSVVQHILDSNAHLKEMDMIIAPDNDDHLRMIADFGLANDINVVNTFSLKNEEVNHNARIFQTNIPHSYLYAEAANRFIRHLGGRTVVFLSHTDENANKNDFVKGLKEELARVNIPYHEVQFSNYLSTAKLDSVSPRNSRVVFVPNSSTKRTLARIIEPIGKFKEKRTDMDIALFGYPEWLTQMVDYKEDFHKIDTYLYSRFYANPQDAATKSFHKRFWYWYNKDIINANPLYAVLGYDTGIYFLSAIREGGKNFALQGAKSSKDRIQTDFSFERMNNWSGFINKSFYFINFAPDSTIRKIKE